MADDAHEPIGKPNSEQEYLDGIAADGSELNIISRFLRPPYGREETRPPIGPHAENATQAGLKSRFHIEADQKLLQADRDHVNRVRKCVRLLEGTVDLGEAGRELLAVQAQIELEIKRRQLERLKTAPLDDTSVETEARAGKPGGRGDVAATTATDDDAETEARAGKPGGRGDVAATTAPDDDAETEARAGKPGGRGDVAATTATESSEPSKGSGTFSRQLPREKEPDPRPREPRAPKFSPALLLMLALRAAKDLPKLSAELRELESRLLPAEAELKLKQEFYLDKGISVVTDTLSSMDEAFGKLGFGNWMPFRYLDQWLMFCGVLNRVLAAHGLMPSGNAAAYRKLLEDTPSISPKAADAGPPKSWGLAFRAREIRHLQGIVDRIEDTRAGRGPPL